MNSYSVNLYICLNQQVSLLLIFQDTLIYFLGFLISNLCLKNALKSVLPVGMEVSNLL